MVWSCVGGNSDTLVPDFIFIVLGDSLNDHHDHVALFPSIGRCMISITSLSYCVKLDDVIMTPEVDV